MIVDVLENLEMYALPFAVDKILEFIKYDSEAHLCDGRYDVWGDNLFMLVQCYSTRPPEACRMESHTQYIDLQYIASGTECCCWENKNMLPPSREQQGDNFFYDAKQTPNRFILRGGMFAVFFPEDAHMPSIQQDTPAPVRKLVFKIRLAQTDEAAEK